MHALNTTNTAWEMVDGGAVVVNITSSAYYSLNETGTFILCRLVRNEEEPATIAKAISEKYAKPLEESIRDVDQFVARLIDEDLLVKKAEGTSGSEALVGDVELPGDYELPEMSRHGELEQLILSGE